MIEILIIKKIINFFINKEVSITIPTRYNISSDHSWKNSYIIDDVFDQVYHKIKSDSKFKKKCDEVSHIKISFEVSYFSDRSFIQKKTIITPYIDGVLYNPFDNSTMISLNRERKINSLLK